jgi:hypothetical protein
MKLADTTPPQTTTSVHPDHEVTDSPAHEYLNVETTTASLLKVDDVTTTAAPPSPVPQGVGSFVEISSPPPAIQTEEIPVPKDVEVTSPPPIQAEVTVTPSPKGVGSFEEMTAPPPPSKIEETLAPKDVEVTTPPPIQAEVTVTPSPNGVGSFEEMTTPPPSKIEETPAPKGVGSFAELTSPPPSSQPDAVSPSTTDEPSNNVDNVETESFFSGIWTKVTGLFAGSTDENVNTIETTSQSSFDEDLHKILFSSQENVIGDKEDDKSNKEATVKGKLT